MINPLDAIKGDLDRIKKDIRVAVETAILRESVRVALSRLITLDHDRAYKYNSAMDAIGEED